MYEMSEEEWKSLLEESGFRALKEEDREKVATKAMEQIMELVGLKPTTTEPTTKEVSKPKISRVGFIDAITDIQLQERKDEKFNNLMTQAFEESNSIMYPPTQTLIDSYKRLLSALMEDEEEFINYFCEDLKFGENPDNLYASNKDGIIDLSSAGKLYDFLLTNR